MGTASGEQYCLRWNDFQANVTGAFSEIRDDEEFLDVTLVSDGREIKAHKLVLSSCSPLFRQMLKKNTHPQPMIFLHGIRFADVSSILNFMYHGEVNVGQDELSRFLAAAEELRIRGLSEKTPEQMTAKSEPQEQTPASSTPSSSKKTEASKESSPSALPAVHRRLPQEYSNEDSPVAKRMRQSDGETEHGDEGGGGGGDEEDGYVEDEDAGEEGGDGAYYNHVDMYGRVVTEGEGSPAQGEDPLLWYQQQEQYYLQQQQQRQLAHLTKKQQQLWHHQQDVSQRQICPHCNKELKNTHSLTVHISRYHREGGESVVEVACPVCKRMYSNKYSLRTHMHLNHKDQLHLIGSGKKNKKSTSAATSSDSPVLIQ